MIETAVGELPPQSDKDGLKLQKEYSSSNNICKLKLKIHKIESKYYESDCLSIITIGDRKLENGRVEVKNFGITNGVMGSYCGNKIGLLSSKNDFYNPQLGDTIVVKINPENNYINELFLMNGKNGNEINEFIKTLKEPYCNGNIIKEELQEPQKIQPINNTQNYYLFGVIVFLLIIIVIFGVKNSIFLRNKGYTKSISRLYTGTVDILFSKLKTIIQKNIV